MTTYTISLDDVDLALLPLRTPYNNFLRKDHYEFEVKKTVTFEVPEPSTLYTCHICAIVMPAVFAREHTTSVKHGANARIASVAAQRLCAHVSALPPPSPPSTALTARFCANCAIVADDDHYKTREHRDAVAHDNRLWDLMKAYAQESEDDDPKYDQFCYNNQRSPNNGMDKNNNHKDDLEIKNDGNNTISNAKAAQAIDTNQPTESIDREKEHKPIEEHIAKNCEINNNLKQYNDDYKTDDINDNISTSNSIEANETVVKVKSNIFIEYPYEVTATGHTYCVVCKCKVPGSAHNKEEHVKGSRHRKVLTQNQPAGLIGQQEFIVNNSDLNGTLEAYTKDEELTDVITDKISTKINKSTDAQITTKTSDLKVDTQIVYPYDLTAAGAGHVRCIVCDCKVASGERNKEEHIRGHEEEEVISQSQPTQPIKDEEEEQTEENNGINDNVEEYSEDEEFSDDNDSMGTNLYEASDEDVIDKSQIEYPFEVTATGVDCVVCDCEVPNYEQCRNEHVQGRTHRNMMNRANESIYEEEEQITEDCETNDSFEEYREDEEIDNNDNNNMRSNIQYPFEVTATGVDCVICDCEVPNYEQSRIEHVQGRTHRNMMNRANESIYEEEERIAEYCETNDSFEEYREDEEFDNNDNNNMRNNMQYPFKVTATGIDCVVCDCHVPNHKHNRIEHIQGQRHHNMIEHPFKVAVTGLRCMVCDCQVPHHEQSRNEHIQGRRHRNMMNRANGYIDEEEQIAEYCETNDSFEEYDEDEEFDNNDQESSSSIRIEYPFEVTAAGHVECVICDCKVLGNVHIREEHIYGMRHRQMVRNQPGEEEQSPENSEIYESSIGCSEDEEFTDDNSDILYIHRRLMP